jgi:hypothetical protein
MRRPPQQHRFYMLLPISSPSLYIGLILLGDVYSYGEVRYHLQKKEIQAVNASLSVVSMLNVLIFPLLELWKCISKFHLALNLNLKLCYLYTLLLQESSL